MRVEGEGHLTAAGLEKASRQLTLGSSAVAGKGNSRLCLLCSQGGISGSGGSLGGGRRNLWWYVCQEAGGLGHLPFSVPSFWWGGGVGAGKWCGCARPPGRFADPLSSSTGLLWRLFSQHRTAFLPGRPPPLARMGWWPCTGVRES